MMVISLESRKLSSMMNELILMIRSRRRLPVYLSTLQNFLVFLQENLMLGLDRYTQ